MEERRRSATIMEDGEGICKDRGERSFRKKWLLWRGRASAAIVEKGRGAVSDNRRGKKN